MDVDSGRFTVPVSGVYMFLLNVYAAPRDPVVLSLRSVAATLCCHVLLFLFRRLFRIL